MKTLEQSLGSQKNAILVWWILFFISLMLVFSPALADWVISFEASMGLAFIGLVMAITSIAMLRVYGNRTRMVASLSNKDSVLDQWECPDRYDENKGSPIPAIFSKNGVFYAGKPYCMKSYDCVIQKAEIIDDEGPALSVVHTVPSSRNGAFRHKSVANIPIPEGKMESAQALAAFYTEAGSKANGKSK